MAFIWSPINIINVVLCCAITVLGIWGYIKGGYKLALYIGLAFGLFCISHILTSAGAGKPLTDILIVIRIIAYLLVLFALYKIVFKR